LTVDFQQALGGTLANFDNELEVTNLDRGNMREFILDFPEQLKKGTRLAELLELTADYKTVQNVVLLGMGGSGIGNEIAKSLFSDNSKVSIETVRDFSLPSYVDSTTLVIAVSFSGNTEEVLQSFAMALEKNAKMIAITTGGKLLDFCKTNLIPFVDFDYPSQPRAAVGYFLSIIVNIFQNLELTNSKFDFSDFDSKIDHNLAKKVAQNILGKVPVICAGEFLSPLAKRSANELNENAKYTAFTGELPEVFHNLIEGVENPKTNPENLFYVILDSNLYFQKNTERIKIFEQILESKKIDYTVLIANGANKLEKLLNMLMLVDIISFYLAILLDVNPTPVETIEYLKNQSS
jgi:glucose/mannose-6-phosphate isomerase